MNKKTAHKIAVHSAKLAAKAAYRFTMKKLAQEAGGARQNPAGATAPATQPAQPQMTYAPAQMGDVTPILNRIAYLERKRILPTSAAQTGVSVTGAALKHFLTKKQSGQEPTPLEASHAQRELAVIERLKDNVGEPAMNQNMITHLRGVLQGQAPAPQQVAASPNWTRQPPAFHRVASLQKVASKLEAKTKTGSLERVARKFERQLKKKEPRLNSPRD
jgi:hypothetical protein